MHTPRQEIHDREEEAADNCLYATFVISPEPLTCVPKGIHPDPELPGRGSAVSLRGGGTPRPASLPPRQQLSPWAAGLQKLLKVNVPDTVGERRSSGSQRWGTHGVTVSPVI